MDHSMNWLPMKLGLKMALNPFLLLQGNETSLGLVSKFQAKTHFSLKPRLISKVPLEVTFSSLALEQSQNKLR